MQPYANLGGDSGVAAHEIGDESIIVEFSDRSAYLYTYASTGSVDIEHMNDLARRGTGLNGFIRRSVGKRYERKLR